MADHSEHLKYEPLAIKARSEQEVQALLARDLKKLYAELPSIMQGDSPSASWKVTLAVDLLRTETADVLRARVWDALGVLVRLAPYAELREAADIAWSVIDSVDSDDDASSEIASIQDFLSDLRTHAFDAAPSGEIPIYADGSRFEIFNRLRAYCCYGDATVSAADIVRLAEDSDFVLRESAVNGISIIYSRSDYDARDLQELVNKFSVVLTEREKDTHWFVRKSCLNAMFFESEVVRELADDS